jgi:hypothetical protein
MKTATTIAATIAALACAGSLRAHHSLSSIETSTPIWVKGTVVSYEPKDPHVMLVLDATIDGGQVERWTIEGPFLGRLARMHLAADFLQPGDVIEICGFRPKAQFRQQPPATGTAGLPRYVHGHVLVLPDGHKQSWGPYGKLDNCIRPSDELESWLDFLNADPLAPALWCNGQHQKTVPSIAPKALVDEINRRVVPPCP